MNRSELTKEFLKKYGGETKKVNGHWYWINNTQKTLISNSWLKEMLSKPKEDKPVEIQQHQNKIVVENVGIETPVEKQESENESTALSEEEIKEMKNKKRREKRLERKLKKQQDEQSN